MRLISVPNAMREATVYGEQGSKLDRIEPKPWSVIYKFGRRNMETCLQGLIFPLTRVVPFGNRP